MQIANIKLQIEKKCISALDGLVKNGRIIGFVIPATPESRNFNPLWTPAFAGVTPN